MSLLLLAGLSLAGSKEDRDLIQQLDREIVALRQRIEQMEAQGGERSTSVDPIYPELVQAYAGTVVKVSHTGPRTFVQLSAAWLFAGDDVRVREEAFFALDFLATALSAHPDTRVVITGYTREDPPPLTVRARFPTNLDLSTARSLAVAKVLVSSFGVAPGRVSVVGRGAVDPIAGNDTPEQSAQNDRVVIELTGAKP